jgi:hypothetical protein
MSLDMVEQLQQEYSELVHWVEVGLSQQEYSQLLD